MMRFAGLRQNALPLIATALFVLTGVQQTKFAAVAATTSTDGPATPGTPAGAADAGHALPAAAAKSTSSPPVPSNLEPLAARDYTGILGKKVMGPDDKELGLLVDVLVDAQRHPRAAVIDFGGFLGVGSRKIAVDWSLLKLAPGEPDWKISLNLNRAEIQGAPEYKPDDPSNKMVGPPPKVSPVTNK
jgi:hypothetical protein